MGVGYRRCQGRRLGDLGLGLAFLTGGSPWPWSRRSCWSSAVGPHASKRALATFCWPASSHKSETYLNDQPPVFPMARSMADDLSPCSSRPTAAGLPAFMSRSHARLEPWRLQRAAALAFGPLPVRPDLARGHGAIASNPYVQGNSPYPVASSTCRASPPTCGPVTSAPGDYATSSTPSASQPPRRMQLEYQVAELYPQTLYGAEAFAQGQAKVAPRVARRRRREGGDRPVDGLAKEAQARAKRPSPTP